jgi:epoxyqueuosine reductase
MNLDNQMRNLAQSCGADFFGVADLARAYHFLEAQGGSAIAEYPRAVSIGMALLHSVVDQLPRRAERAAALSYRHHLYEVVDRRLDQAALRLSGLLEREGYRALPIPASQEVDGEHVSAVFSHKLGAHLAGLGWIGKSCLLITPDRGPRLRLATVLTDAPLSAAEQSLEQRCGTCAHCVDVCPVHAFTGRSFREHEPREARFDAVRCDRYIDEMKERGEVAVCGLCLYSCPHGRR